MSIAKFCLLPFLELEKRINLDMKILIPEPENIFDRQLIQHIDLKLCFLPLDLSGLFPDELCEVVQNPESADFIVFPSELTNAIDNLSLFGVLGLFNTCKLFHEYYWKFIFVYDNDCSWKIPMGGTWLRTSFDSRILSSESICIPYFVQNRGLYSTAHCKLRANFVGAVHTHPTRSRLVSYLSEKNHWSKILLLIRAQFHSNSLVDEPEWEKRSGEMSEAMRKSFMTFCPRGTGMNSVRFFETMSSGRIPILISENCGLPFRGEIDYGDFSFEITSDELSRIDQLLSLNDEKLKKMCEISQKIFSECFARDVFCRKLTSFLMKNRGEIYEQRKSDAIFGCRTDKESLYNYCFDYLSKYQKAEEQVNVFEMSRQLTAFTKDAKNLKLLTFIRNEADEYLSSSTLNILTDYALGLRGFLTREFGDKFDDETITQENLGVLTDHYSRKVLQGAAD
jgi:hypothetical protein